MTDTWTELEYGAVLDTFKTASEWHGGQSSALYSYSSTGEIHGEDHKADLLYEIEACIESAQRSESDLEQAALDHLRYVVECWPKEAV